MAAGPLCRRDGLANYIFIQFLSVEINHAYLTTDLPLWQVLNASKRITLPANTAVAAVLWRAGKHKKKLRFSSSLLEVLSQLLYWVIDCISVFCVVLFSL